MNCNKRQLGGKGEQAVCQYLTNQGYTILETNYVSSHEEIDVIAQKNGIIAFCEVKTRKAGTRGKYALRPSRAVNREKMQHLLHCAEQYLVSHYGSECPEGLQPRMDVAEVWYTVVDDNYDFKIRYIEGAFGKSNLRPRRRRGR